MTVAVAVLTLTSILVCPRGTGGDEAKLFRRLLFRVLIKKETRVR